jgi:radical SAM protein with 4Fe4S-binding SPASM domain
MHDDLFRVGASGESSLPPIPSAWSWSDRIWAVQRGDWIALFRPLNLALAYLPAGFLKNDSGWDEPESQALLEALIKERFVLKRDDDETAEHDRLIQAAQAGTFRFICMIPTTACSLKCDYCHQRVDDAKPSLMTREELVRGLEICARLCSDLTKPVDVLLYGGDPLAAFSLTKEVLKLTRPGALFRQPVRVSFTTSGIGLTARKADLLAANDVFVILSVDGLPAINDIVRASHGGSAFQAVERAYAMLKKRGGRVGLSVTMGRHNVEDFAAQVEFLLQRFQPDDIGLNAFLHRQNGQPNPYQIGSIEALSALIEGFNLTRKYGVYAEQPFRRLKPFVYRQPLLKDCSAPGERLVLAPGGLMGFCDSCYPQRRWFYPQDEFKGAENPDYAQWAGLSSPQMPWCRVCPAMTVCGGACRFDAYQAGGRLDGVDSERCRFERGFLAWMIWQVFDRMNDNALWYVPSDSDREKLLENVALNAANQPFTAGSIMDSGRGLKSLPE